MAFWARAFYDRAWSEAEGRSLVEIKKMFNLNTIRTPVGSDDEEKPLCPHCAEPLHEVVTHRSDHVGLANLHVFSCPSCRKVLGTTTAMK